MQILYKQATKQYIHYDASARRSDLVSDVNEATEMANDLAVSILNRCSKKLKGFESIPAESVKKSASSTLSNSSVKIIKTPRRRFTAKERRDIYIRDKGTCGICGRFVPPDSFTVDHIVPISKGGTYDYNNLQCCCRKCNQLKDDALQDDFFQVMLSVVDYQISDKHNKKIKKGIKKIYKKAYKSSNSSEKKITAKKRIKQKRTDQTASRKISVRLFFCGKYLKRCIVLPKSLYLITPRLCRSRYQFAQQMSSEAVKLSAVRFFAADQRSRKTECRA